MSDPAENPAVVDDGTKSQKSLTPSPQESKSPKPRSAASKKNLDATADDQQPTTTADNEDPNNDQFINENSGDQIDQELDEGYAPESAHQSPLPTEEEEEEPEEPLVIKQLLIKIFLF